jgi:nicotinamide-nucleotide amidase
LGPTEDDLTRAALAEAAGQELVLDPASYEQIRGFFAARQRAMSASNEAQALRPAGGRALRNPVGTAPGLFVEIAGTPFYVLPGVPHEMRELFALHVAPALRALGGGRVVRSRTLHTFGTGESIIGERIRDLMQRGRNPEVGTTAKLGVISIRINATAAAPEAAAALLDQTELELRSRLGEWVFGRDDETLASAVGELLAARGATLALAESCTGGLIGALLTDVPGSSRYFRGGVVAYANELKRDLLGVPGADLEQCGAVSDVVARQMAEGARLRLAASIGLSVTGVAGPGGGTTEKPVGLVYVGVADAAGAIVHELRLGETTPRDVIRNRAAQSALNAVRLRLIGAR